MKLSIASLIVFVLCMNIALAEQVRVIDKVIIKQVTDNRFKQWMPDVSGDNVVWLDYRNGNADIYMKNIVTDIENQITNTPQDEQQPIIDGNYVIFYTGEDRLIGLYNIQKGTTDKLSVDWSFYPFLDGNKIFFPKRDRDSTPSSPIIHEITVYDIPTKETKTYTTPETLIHTGWYWLDLIDYPLILTVDGVYNLETAVTNKIKITSPWGIENDIIFDYVSGNYALINIKENKIVKIINLDIIGGLTSAGKFFKNNLLAWDTPGSSISILDLNTMKKYSVGSNSPTDYEGRFGFDGKTIVWADTRNRDKFPLYPEINDDIYVAQIKFKMQEMEVSDEPVAPSKEENIRITEETVVENKPVKQDLSGCTKDSECENSFCNTETGNCVECLQDAHCTVRDKPIETKKCSLDNANVILETTSKVGKCDPNKLVCYMEESVKSSTLKKCQDFNTYCHNSECGCPETFKACKEAGKCVEKGLKKAGDWYDCVFECKSGLGKNGQCIDPITIELSTTKKTVEVNDGTDITISFDNALDYAVDADLTVTFGNGISISSSGACQSGSGNLCKSFHKIGAKEVKQLSVRVDCIDAIKKIPIKGKITYTAGDLSTTTEKMIEIDCVKGVLVRRNNFFDELGGFFQRLIRFLRKFFK